MLNKDLDNIRDDLSKIKHPRISKILQSDKIDLVITKVQNLYHKIANKLVIKYNLEDEIKQGKIFTILIALLVFILLIVLTVFFTLTLNSIIGIGLIFSVFRQIVFCLKWGYTIINNKGKTIKKYLSNLFPNSKILKEEKVRKKIPIYEESILYQIEDLIDLLNKENIDLEVQKEIAVKLKSVVNMLNLNELDFKDEIYKLEHKKEMASILADAYKLYQDNYLKNQRQEEFLILKNDVLEQIDEVENKIYVKKKI
ncbi:MAG: hypothetical protein IKN63_00765 [Bacilli bacterium]|nr:hypothetical protein [Bacilli bacterium]